VVTRPANHELAASYTLHQQLHIMSRCTILISTTYHWCRSVPNFMRVQPVQSTFPSISSPPFLSPLPSRQEAALLISSYGSREHCQLSQWGLGQSPSQLCPKVGIANLNTKAYRIFFLFFHLIFVRVQATKDPHD